MAKGADERVLALLLETTPPNEKSEPKKERKEEKGKRVNWEPTKREYVDVQR